MKDIVDYSKKLNEELKKQKKIFIIVCLIVAFLTFSIGFYASYAFNNSNDKNNYKNKLDTVYSVLKEEWYYGKEDDNLEKTLIDKAIVGMLDTEKDPFTRYLTSLGSLADTYEGLGITVSEYKEYFVISDIASKVNIDAGFKKGDILKKIDGNSLENKNTEYIKTLIENKKEVVVTIQRGTVEMDLTGYVTKYSPVTVFGNFSSEEMAYVRISEFAMDTADYLDQYLKEAKEEGYEKIIIDLRDNPGGYISSVVECADLLMEKGKVVLSTKNKDGDSYSYKTSSNDKYDFNKIVVLINNGSASGAEALSAALNENMGDVVDLVGVTTYGKGSAQKTMYFTDGTYFHYTYALWYTPNGNSIQKVGVAPEKVYTGTGIHLLDFVSATLKKNDYGSNVYNLKMIMKELDYYSGEINSFFDDSLVETIKEYQKANGFEESKQSGELDDLTIRYILAEYYDSQVLSYAKEVSDVISEYGA